MPHSRPVRSAATLALLAALLSGCRYTSFPVIPQEVRGELPTRLSGGSLVRQGQELVLSVRLDPRGGGGFVTVAWFRDDTELGRDAVYLDAKEPAATLRTTAPEQGNYRAVVSFEGNVLRQF
ncbi:hypothetical protein, partial [Deinococcus pimensis]|uniref:hypothetical protein n=1 Tax=Deinococcus pimensis TaxID=309888 RepID=UPI0005EB8C3C